MNRIFCCLSLAVAGCSSSESPLLDDGAPVLLQDPVGEINALQVAYPELVRNDREPSLTDVLITNLDRHWNCTFTSGSGVLWQSAFYFFSDGTAKALYAQGFDGFDVPTSFDFKWEADQSLVLTAELDQIDQLTIFDFSYETDPQLVLGTPNYEFVASNSLGGDTICGQYEGEA